VLLRCGRGVPHSRRRRDAFLAQAMMRISRGIEGPTSTARRASGTMGISWK
jgi:hypothetical protein